jgi:hypothetical protein
LFQPGSRELNPLLPAIGCNFSPLDEPALHEPLDHPACGIVGKIGSLGDLRDGLWPIPIEPIDGVKLAERHFPTVQRACQALKDVRFDEAMKMVERPANPHPLIVGFQVS